MTTSKLPGFSRIFQILDKIESGAAGSDDCYKLSAELVNEYGPELPKLIGMLLERHHQLARHLASERWHSLSDKWTL